MTRDDIVRLWDEANNWGIPIRSGLVDELERFAALVAAQRKPLTEQQMVDIAIRCGCASADWIEFARAVERAHGIGGDK